MLKSIYIVQALFLSSIKRKFNESGTSNVVKVDNTVERNKKSVKRPKWRFGPARYWYDQKGLPTDGDICGKASIHKEVSKKNKTV